jgi:hypothetical protein
MVMMVAPFVGFWLVWPLLGVACARRLRAAAPQRRSRDESLLLFVCGAAVAFVVGIFDLS